MSLGDFLTKLPAMVLCLEESPGGFCDGGCCCCFPHWRFLCFQVTFPCHWHSTLASQAREGHQQIWALLWLLSVALLFTRFFRHIFTASTTVLSGYFFTHRRFLTLHSFPTFLARSYDSDTGNNTPPRILLWAYLHRVVPFQLTHGLELLIF